MAVREDSDGDLRNDKDASDDTDVEKGLNANTLSEERRSTGRALATGIIVFLVGLGLCHAVVYGAPQRSTILGGSIIMLLYVISLLYACYRKKKLTRSHEAAIEREIEEVIVKASMSAKKLHKQKRAGHEPRPTDRPMFIRTYSVA